MLIIVLLTTFVDYVVIMHYHKDPWFTYKFEDNIYYGFIYRIKLREGKKEFCIFDYKIAETEIVKETDFEIIDKTKDKCQDGKYVFYEDDSFRYYFNCLKEYYILIGKVEYSLRNALENDLITIDDLEEKEIQFEKETSH